MAAILYLIYNKSLNVTNYTASEMNSAIKTTSIERVLGLRCACAFHADKTYKEGTHKIKLASENAGLL